MKSTLPRKYHFCNKGRIFCLSSFFNFKSAQSSEQKAGFRISGCRDQGSLIDRFGTYSRTKPNWSSTRKRPEIERERESEREREREGEEGMASGHRKKDDDIPQLIASKKYSEPH